MYAEIWVELRGNYGTKNSIYRHRVQNVWFSQSKKDPSEAEQKFPLSVLFHSPLVFSLHI